MAKPLQANTEKEFSENLEELKREETRASKTMEEAEEKKAETIRAAKEDGQKIVENSRIQAAKERKKVLDAELKRIQSECDAIIEDAEKEAERLKRGKDVERVAEKLLPLVLKAS
ncbi:hypothetical protein KJ765_06680 [Candidatus Micrarchaeota archaeon]|nr:hypothetical protein [Candidatus Micrarchaeota archaeon]